MSLLEFPLQHPRRSLVAAIVPAIACIASGAAGADTLTRSVDVQVSPSALWAQIGPFCAIKDWLPPVGTCSQDGATPPTRTLVTKDGSATFVERQTSRNDAQHFYSYTFLSSPLPVTNYSSTIKVTLVGNGWSNVTWRGTYTPLPGKESAAKEALNGIYMAGLDSIRSQAQQKAAP